MFLVIDKNQISQNNATHLGLNVLLLKFYLYTYIQNDINLFAFAVGYFHPQYSKYNCFLARREWNDMFDAVKQKGLEPKILYPVR